MKLNFSLFQTYKNTLLTASAYLSASLIPATVNLVVNPFLAKNLSPYDYSIIGYFTSFNALILPIIGFSFLSYYARNYFIVSPEKRLEIKNTLLASILIFGTLLMLFFIGAFYLYALHSKLSVPFYPYGIIGFTPTFFGWFFSLYLIDKKMERKPSTFLKVSISNSFLLVFLTILLVIVFKGGALGRLYAILISSILFGIYSFFSLITKFEINRAILIDAIKLCWPLTLSAILYYFLSGVDKFFLERLNDNTNFGYYNVAFQISTYTSLIGTALFQTFDPDIFKAIADKNKNRLVKIIFMIVVPCIVVNLIFILLAKPIITILTYGRYVKSVGFSQILALRNIVTPLFFILSDIIIGLGFTKIELYNRLIGSVLSIFLFKYLISNYGFTGAAWGQSISMFIMCCISMSFFLYKKVRS